MLDAQKKGFDVGGMDQLVTFESFTQGKDGYGTITKTWAAVGAMTNIYAKVDQVNQDESVIAGVQQGKEVLKFTMRYVSYTLELFRIVYNGGYYYPISINPIGRNKYMEIIAENIRTGQS
jgi:head-tail adaptor